MTKVTMTVNGKSVSRDIPDETLLSEFLREHLRLTGTHIGCDTSQCGACTVHVNGSPTRSCVTPHEALAGVDITTIEGAAGKEADAIRNAWEADDVPQCGYCQSGQILAAVALLSDKPDPTDDDIDVAMSGNICRCNTYVSIRRAIKKAASNL